MEIIMAENTKSSLDPQVQQFADLIKDIRVAMLITVSADNVIHSSPLLNQGLDEDGNLWFLISKSSQKVQDISFNNHVNLTFAISGKYIFAPGTAEFVNDDFDKVLQLWMKSYEAWFPKGPNDPNIQLLKIEVEKIEYWEGHSYPISKILEFVKKTTHSHNIKTSEHGEITLKH